MMNDETPHDPANGQGREVPLPSLAGSLIVVAMVLAALVGHRLPLNVVVTFLAVLLWGWLWGLGVSSWQFRTWSHQ